MTGRGDRLLEKVSKTSDPTHNLRHGFLIDGRETSTEKPSALPSRPSSLQKKKCSPLPSSPVLPEEKSKSGTNPPSCWWLVVRRASRQAPAQCSESSGALAVWSGEKKQHFVSPSFQPAVLALALAAICPASSCQSTSRVRSWLPAVGASFTD